MAVATTPSVIVVLAALVLAVTGDVGLFVTKTVNPRMFAVIALAAAVLAYTFLLRALRSSGKITARKEI